MRKTIIITFLVFLSTTIKSQLHSDNKAITRIKDLITEQKFESAKQSADSLLGLISPQEQPVLFLRTTSTLISVYNKLGSYTEGIKIGDRLLQQDAELIDINNYASAEFYLSIGEAYHFTQSNNEKSLSYFNQARSYSEKSKNADPELEASILRGIGGTYYYMAEYKKSIHFLEMSQSILEDLGNEEKIALNLRSIGNAYWGMKKYDNAAASYNKSLDVFLNQDPVDSLRVGHVLHAMGYIYMDQEDFKKAYITFVKASELLQKKYPEVSSHLVWVYGDVGRALIELKKYETALVWLQKALNANVFEYQQSDYYQNPPLVDLNDDFQHFMILKLKGQAFLSKYLKSGNNRDLNGLIDSYIQADEQIDNIRRSIPKAEDQSTISYYSTELYSNAIDAMVAVYEENSEYRFLELAHYFMEKRKITSVHLKFLEASAKSSNLLPADLLKQDQALLDQIASLKTKLRKYQAANSDSTFILRQQLFKAQERYEAFINEIKRGYPSYHASRFNLKVKSAKNISQFLNNRYHNRAIVTYYNFGEKLRISILTSDTLVVKVIRHDLQFNELAQNFRKALTNPETERLESDTLNQLLIDPIKSILGIEIKQITFILDPALQLIPMELMRLDGSYLFERFDISYHFSGTLFASGNNQKSFGNSFVGFAPSFDSLSMLSLPGAREEVSNASAVFGGSIYMEDEADEATFKERGEKSDFIHLATHAIVDDQNPESSYLQFSPGNNSEDGRLYFFEIYNLNLSAQLVTLSACNTGFGKVQRGEGVMSLSRAFAYAGVPATVVSLWPASDKSTPELMKYFYKNLKDGQAKDVALNNARKQYLATAQGKARHPFYWGGFVLIGDNSPIEEDTNLLVYLIPSILIIVMILTIYRRKQRGTA
ncbi:CHAT domain-containing protein [Ekhidna sp.]|uniref:CHAT domain-containing protein n=1 Tax=Ekhidna sp. TaxID=2608089 RepID=UPI003CCC29E8